jgi:hypothetical protein
MSTIWLVSKQGISSHIPCFVSDTRKQAEIFCNTYTPDRDGWHEWVIEEFEVGHITGNAMKDLQNPEEDKGTTSVRPIWVRDQVTPRMSDEPFKVTIYTLEGEE